eukprot:gene5385-6718_t
MKSKLLIITILLVSINLIYSAPCDEVPVLDVSLANPTCSSLAPLVPAVLFASPSEFTQGSIWVKNFLQFHYIDISPKAPLQIDGGDSNPKIQYLVEPGITYTIQYGTNLCNKTTTYSVLGPNFNTVHAKCPGSKGQIQFSNNAVSVTEITVEVDRVTPSPVTIPMNPVASYEVPIGKYNVKWSSTSFSPCEVTYQISTLTDKEPIYIVTPPFCNNSDGSLFIRNYGDYSDLKLYSELTGQEYQHQSGVFLNLKADSYKLIAVSNDCGEQTIFIPVDYSFPRIIAESIPSCPVSFKVHLVPPLEGGELIYRGEAIVNNTVRPDSYDEHPNLNYAGGACEFQGELPESFRVKPPVEYTIKHPDKCEDKVTITLFYDPVLLQDLVIKDSSNQNITLTPENTFQLKYGERATLSHDCYHDYIRILAQTPSPFYEVTGITNGTCADKFSVKIFNYLDFPDLYVYTNGDPNNAFYPDKNGKFQDFNTGVSLTMVAQYGGNFSNCEIKYDTINTQATNEITVSSIIFRPPYCHNKVASVEYILDGPLGKTPLRVYNWTYMASNPAIYLSYSIGGCSGDVIWKIPKFDYLYPIPKVTPLTPSTCLYSDNGKLNLEVLPPLIVDSIKIDGEIASITNNPNGVTINNVKGGEHTLIINYRENKCPPLEMKAKMETQHPDTISYNITNLQSCSLSSGGIALNNRSQFSSVTLTDSLGNSYTEDSITQEFKDLPADYFILSFTIPSINCQGYQSIHIEPPGGFGVEVQIIEKPTCNHPDLQEAVVKFRPHDASNQNIPIQFNQREFGDSKAGDTSYSARPGKNTYVIGTESCRFFINFDLPVEEPVIKYRPIVPYSCYEIGTVEIYSENPRKVKFNRPGHLDATSDQYLVDINDYYAFHTVQWNNLCQKELVIEFTEPDPVQPFINSIYTPNCGKSDGKVVIQDFENFQFLYENNPFKGPHLTHLSGTQVSFRYRHVVTKCKGEMGIEFTPYPYTIKYQQINETCHGSSNGRLNVSIESNPDHYYHLVINSDVQAKGGGSFTGLTSGEYSLTEYSYSNPLCYTSQTIVFKGSEPEYSIKTEGSCNEDGTIFADISLPEITKVEYSLNSSMPPSTTGKFTSLKTGDYSINATITDPICRRILDPVSITVGVSSIDSRINNTACQSLLIVPILDRPTFKVVVTGVDSFSKEYDSPSEVSLNDLKNGTYMVKIFTDTCSLEKSVSVIPCIAIPPTTSSDESEEKKNIGLIVGLVIGLTAAAALIAAALIYFMKKRKTIRPNMIDEPITMSTVSVFQGGKITKIDEF